MIDLNEVSARGIIRLHSLVIFFLLLAGANLSGQTYYFDRYGPNEGLGSSKVNSVIQDTKDWLWIGTESGVSRFGGKSIEIFSVDDSLSSGGVKSLFEDSKGTVWFGHLNGGLSIYNGKSFRSLSFDSLVIKGDITGISEIEGRLWFTSSFDGALSAEYDPVSRILVNIKQYMGAQGLSDRVFSSYIDRDGIFYCITDVGIKKYNPEQDRFETYRPDGLSNFFNVVTMFHDSRGDRWFGTHNGGLFRMDAGSGEFTVYDVRDGLASNYISTITEDSRGRIWVGSWGEGITLLEEGKLRLFDNTNGLDAMDIKCIIEDREGNIIIGSDKSGLLIFKGDYFVNYYSDSLFPDKKILAVEEDKFGRLWLGSNMGITLYDRDPVIPQSWFFNEENRNISNKVKFIKNDLEGNIWVGTDGDGIYRYLFKEDRFIKAEIINDILYNDLKITALAVDHNNNLWIGTLDGVGFWNLSTGVGTRYTQGDGLSGNWVTALLVSDDGNIWIGTESNIGITCYDHSTGEFRIIETGYNDKPQSICQSADGILWVGTANGLFGIKEDSVIVHLTQVDGLISNNIRQLQPDGNGYLYIGTNLGLNRYNLETGMINTFTRNNGFIGIETSPNASIMDKKGQLWFGTNMGVTCLNPLLIPPPDLNPLTHISGIRVNLEPREMKEGMRLSYEEKSIVFDYYSVCLTNPDAVRYSVKLVGAEDDWRPETDQTTAIYSSLQPGRYTFMVKAVNSDGIWNEEPVTYSFTIRPPFYFSPFFILLVSILIIAAVITYIKIRERNLHIEKHRLEEKVEERTAEVVQKSQELEEKNRDITASIRYAERIQMAMLPPEDSFDQTFVLFKPKDIVSGDFYWMHETDDYQFIAAVDCTGHGVPGAFMSIIGFNSLTKIVSEYGIIKPSSILDKLNVEVTMSLLQRGEKAINDGMDLALVAYNKKNKTVEYSGAYNPMIIVRDGKAETIKADRFPIGMEYLKAREFTNHVVEVKSGDMIYLFSDGFSDQFGGASGKKFKVVSLKNAFSVIYRMEMKEQKDYLEELLYDWMGDQSQVDDILIIGTRIP